MSDSLNTFLANTIVHEFIKPISITYKNNVDVYKEKKTKNQSCKQEQLWYTDIYLFTDVLVKKYRTNPEMVFHFKRLIIKKKKTKTWLTEKLLHLKHANSDINPE